MVNTNLVTYFLSKNQRWMKKEFDNKTGKSKTVFVPKKEIENIPDKIKKNKDLNYVKFLKELYSSKEHK